MTLIGSCVAVQSSEKKRTRYRIVFVLLFIVLWTISSVYIIHKTKVDNNNEDNYDPVKVEDSSQNEKYRRHPYFSVTKGHDSNTIRDKSRLIDVCKTSNSINSTYLQSVDRTSTLLTQLWNDYMSRVDHSQQLKQRLKSRQYQEGVSVFAANDGGVDDGGKKIFSSSKNDFDDRFLGGYYNDHWSEFVKDLDEKQFACGLHKCYISLKKKNSSSSSLHPAISSTTQDDIGWLIAPNTNYFEYFGYTKLKMLDGMMLGWELAKRLYQEYGIKHYLLEAPFLFYHQNNTNSNPTAGDFFTTKCKKCQLKKVNRILGHRKGVVMQKVQSAPTTRIEFGRGDTKGDEKVSRQGSSNLKVADKVEAMSSFVELIVRSDKGGKLFNKTNFVRNLKRDSSIAIEILQEVPDYGYDFQLVLDSQGSLYHIDFDRLFQPHKATAKRKNNIFFDFGHKFVTCNESHWITWTQLEQATATFLELLDESDHVDLS